MYPFDVSDFVGFGPRLRFRDISRTSPVLTAPPTIPVGWLEECKLHARVSTTVEDPILQTYLLAAVNAVEIDAETALLTETRTLYLDFFPAWEIELRFPPVQSVTDILYLDFNNVQQTLPSTAYRVDTAGRPGIITPIYGSVWPVAFPVIKAVQVDFVTGLASEALVSPFAKLAIYQMFASFYWNREMDELEEESYWRLLDRFRWRRD